MRTIEDFRRLLDDDDLSWQDLAVEVSELRTLVDRIEELENRLYRAEAIQWQRIERKQPMHGQMVIVLRWYPGSTYYSIPAGLETKVLIYGMSDDWPTDPCLWTPYPPEAEALRGKPDAG